MNGIEEVQEHNEFNNLKVEDKLPASASNFDKICRTCLSEQKNQSIFALKYNEISILSLLDSCVSIKVKEEDELPHNLCSTCLQEIIRIHMFREKCKQNEDLLRFILTEQTLLKPDVEDSSKNDTDCEPLASNSDSDTETKIDENPSCKKIKNENRLQVSCRDCSEEFSSRTRLRKHRKTAKHPEVRNHACSICSKMFTSSKLRQHMRAHTKEKPYVCSVCSQAFSMSGNLKRHMMTHTGERPHVCEFCGKGFIQATSLHTHLRTHASCERSDGPKFVCTVCGKGFKRLTPYNAHLKKHYTDKIEEQKVQQQSGVREHVCEICKRAYKTKHLLKTHLLTHGEKTFLCSDCGKGFVTKAALQSHLKVHTGEKPHTCSFCKKSFAHVGSFDAHMLIHMGQKPYRCNVCAKAFTQLSHLKYHLRTHSGERPYSCTYCGKSFALKGNLTVHIRTHTGETPYICSVCGKGFYDSSSMKKHQRGHSELNLQSSNIVGNTTSL